jgi:hypothetical protein
LFGYLGSKKGALIAIFFGSPNRETLNSVNLYFMDPVYEDQKMILLRIKDIIGINQANYTWKNSNHTVQYTKIWKEREGDDSTYLPIQARWARWIQQ